MFYRNKFLFALPLSCLIGLSSLSAEEAKAKTTLEEVKTEEEKVDLKKVSEAFGHLIGKNLDTLGFEFDMTQVVKGIQDAALGKEAPMTESDCVQAISLVQEEAFEKLAAENLQKADTFMAKNKANERIVELEKNLVQYKVEKEGTGSVVEEHFSPMIRYTGRFLDGKVFGASQEDELISLDETIPGFSKGIIGMKEGEERTLYIHPSRGYGTTGYLPPNSMLIFTIEVVKANTSLQEEESMTTLPSEEVDEFATPEQGSKEVIR